MPWLDACRREAKTADSSAASKEGPGNRAFFLGELAGYRNMARDAARSPSR